MSMRVSSDAMTGTGKTELKEERKATNNTSVLAGLALRYFQVLWLGLPLISVP
jgi:hypothetical protein